MVFCGKCGLQLSAGDTVCPRCGTPTDPDLMPDESYANNPTIASGATFSLVAVDSDADIIMGTHSAFRRMSASAKGSVIVQAGIGSSNLLSALRFHPSPSWGHKAMSLDQRSVTLSGADLRRLSVKKRTN